MDTGNGNGNEPIHETNAELTPGGKAAFATQAQFATAVPVPVPIANVDISDKSNNVNTDLQATLVANPLAIPGTTYGDNDQKKIPSAPPQNNIADQWRTDAYGPSKDPTAIDPSKLKDLVGKSYAQTLLYLNLTKQIIKSQLVNNTDDTTLIDLQTKIDKSIKELKLSDEASATLKVNPISEDSSVTISELLLEIAGLGMAAAAAGGKRKSKKSKKRRGKSKKRRTRRH